MLKKFWNNLGITQKFSLIFYIILGLLGLMLLLGYGMLSEVHQKTVSDMELSTRIQKLVLEMINDLEQARRLKNEFSLKYSGIAVFAPDDTFSDQIQQHLIAVSKTSDKLQKLIAPSYVSQSLQNNHINLNLYFSMTKQSIVTFEEMQNLVRKRNAPQKGLQEQLFEIAAILEPHLQLLGNQKIRMRFNQMQLHIRNYFLSRKRPFIQSTLNAVSFLREDINRSTQIPPDQKTDLIGLLTWYADTANQIPDIDNQIKSKSNEFDLNAMTLESVSQSLIQLAEKQVADAEIQDQKITRTAEFILLFAAIFGFLLMNFLAYIIHQTITRKIIHLTTVATAFQAGNLDVRGRINTRDELGKLAEGFNQMAIRLQGFIQDLEQKVALRTQELVTANQSLIKEIADRKQAEIDKKKLEAELRQSHKIEAIGTMAGGIAHDFNNIIGIILGNTELAMEDVPEWNPVYVNLNEIKTASLRAGHIVKQILSFSRKTEQDLKPIDIIPVVRESLRLVRSSIPTTIDIRQNISAKDQTILADPVQVSQVLLNLCINASHAMEETTGTIDIAVENMFLDEKEAALYPELHPGNHIRITVHDTGPGIAPEIINRVFDPYFTTKDVGKGSGMGLAVVLGIVKNHRGKILVESRLDEGTSFHVLFPVVAEKPEVEVPNEEDLFQGHETILFVDDEESIVNLFRQVLERLGYRVETKIQPTDALALFQSHPDLFDLVITDMAMPKMSGVNLAEKLREIRSDIPIIICSGNSTLINEQKAKEMGINAFILKPIARHQMAKTVRNVLDNVNGTLP